MSAVSSLPFQRKALFYLAALSFLAIASPGAPLYGQSAQSGVTLMEPPTPLLPRQFGAWQQVPAGQGGSGAPMPDDANEPFLREDGLARASSASYQRDQTGESLLVKAYQFGDATGAFAAYTYYRSSSDHAINGANLGTNAVERGDQILIWSGPSVVTAEFHGGRRVADLADLVRVLPKAGGAKGVPPLLPTFVPAKGLEPDSLKYALGPESYKAAGGILPAGIVGFDKSAEAVTARYANRGLLTLLLYPTPQIAGEHGRQIEAEMNREGAAAGIVKLRREGPLVLMTSGRWPASEAQELVESIHLRSELTWNKPVPLEFHAELRKTASLLFTIIELSIVLMLAAIVMGLFFGGGRAMIRVLQGKPAASEPEFLRINLRDSPGESGSFKPLH